MMPRAESDPEILAAKDGREPAVDVIVPVYRGLEETRACLESLLEFPQQTPHEIVVINDASPEAGIREYARELSQAGKITLIENETNAGFVDSVNLGMMMHLDRDVVLLNSDTEVHGDWLDRLRRCATSSPDVGTATPFSNNATQCSYPCYRMANELPAGASLASLDDVFADVNKARSVEIPTAVGFCIYITRRCIKRVGYFDSLHYDRGYCEENDFSVRAHENGFRHLLCGDLFVYHKGGASFGESAGPLSRQAMKNFNLLNPDYWPLVAKHIDADPERALRRRVDIARLAASGRPKILFVDGSGEAAIDTEARKLAKLLAPRVDVLLLGRSGGPEDDSVAVEWVRAGEEFRAFFRPEDDMAGLIGFLGGIGVTRVHFHHAAGLASEVLDIPARLGVPYDFTAYDYYTVCPFRYLIGADGNYCGLPGAQECEDCFSERPIDGEMNPSERRRFFAGLMSGADRVLVPSKEAYERLRDFFPDANLVLLPGPPADEKPGGEDGQPELKILALGNLSGAEGLAVLEACAEDARKRQLPLYFRVLGRPLERVRCEPDLPLSFAGPCQNGSLGRLIERERADLIFFPSRWPRMQVFGLDEALASGVPIAAPSFGAFTEALDGEPAAFFLDINSDAATLNDSFMELRERLDKGAVR